MQVQQGVTQKKKFGIAEKSAVSASYPTHSVSFLFLPHMALTRKNKEIPFCSLSVLMSHNFRNYNIGVL